MKVPRVLLEVSEGTLLTETSGEVVIRARDTGFYGIKINAKIRKWFLIEEFKTDFFFGGGRGGRNPTGIYLVILKTYHICRQYQRQFPNSNIF